MRTNVSAFKILLIIKYMLNGGGDGGIRKCLELQRGQVI